MKDILLPSPVRTGGMPLRDALMARRSIRQFSERRFNLQSDSDLQILSDLLWAAFGFISPKRRSAPSSHNSQETDLYVLLPEGAFRYVAAGHHLTQVTDTDLRAASGFQPFVGQPLLHGSARLVINGRNIVDAIAHSVDVHHTAATHQRIVVVGKQLLKQRHDLLLVH